MYKAGQVATKLDGDSIMDEKQLYWVGVDVSKDDFDAAVVGPGQHPSAEVIRELPAQTFLRDPKGVKEFIRWLRGLVPGSPLEARVVMEATGEYSIQLTAMISKRCPDLFPSIVNPQRTKGFRESLGLRNKTDRLDARALAFYGLSHRPDPYEPLSPAQAELRSLSRCRGNLINERTAHQARLRQKSISSVSRDCYRELVALLNKKIDVLHKEMLRVIRSDEDLKRDYALLLTIPGVGFVTAATALGELGDLRRFGSSRQIGAHAGVTASHNDSGKSTPPARMSKKGNARLRRALYMASLSASKFNPHMREAYQRLERRGKAKKVALGAVMRKLIVLMRAIVVSGRPYDRKWKTQWKNTPENLATPVKVA
jgi:transposase